MPAGLVFIVGGARSGKSAYALSLASSSTGRMVYIATAALLDPEMRERAAAHRLARPDGWTTVEETLDVAGKVEALGGGCSIIVDCLTLWVSNLLSEGLEDAEVLGRARALARSCALSRSSVVVVSNEVGLGIVPDNALARRFRDLAGSVNQAFAAEAGQVWFVASGVPLRMK